MQKLITSGPKISCSSATKPGTWETAALPNLIHLISGKWLVVEWWPAVGCVGLLGPSSPLSEEAVLGNSGESSPWFPCDIFDAEVDSASHNGHNLLFQACVQFRLSVQWTDEWWYRIKTCFAANICSKSCCCKVCKVNDRRWWNSFLITWWCLVPLPGGWERAPLFGSALYNPGRLLDTLLREHQH